MSIKSEQHQRMLRAGVRIVAERPASVEEMRKLVQEGAEAPHFPVPKARRSVGGLFAWPKLHVRVHPDIKRRLLEESEAVRFNLAAWVEAAAWYVLQDASRCEAVAAALRSGVVHGRNKAA